MRRTLITILTALMVAISALMACAPPYHELEDTPHASILAASLIKAYNEHPIRWKNDVGGDTVNAKGTVESIKEDGQIIFKVHSFIQQGKKLVCQFADPQVLTTVNYDDILTVSGTVDSISLKTDRYQHAHLSDCRILEHQPAR